MSNEKFRLCFERRAQGELESLEKTNRLKILNEIQKYLSGTPYQPIKTRIKKMTGFIPALFRLRVGDFRVYYRIEQQTVVILAVVHKKDSKKWLRS